MADDNDQYADFVISIFVTFIIFLVIISALPLFGYIINSGVCNFQTEDYPSVKEFATTVIGDNTPYNTFGHMYLFCSYIPYKKLRMCINKKPPDEHDKDEIEVLKLYNFELYKINEIRKNISDLKTFCDGVNYDSIKKSSDESIAKNKANRINREHDENMSNIKEYGKDKRETWKNNIEWAKRISSWFHSFIKFIIDLAFKIFDYVIRFINMFIPVLKAIFSNEVITGYMVIIITIYLIIYGIKKALEPPKEEEEEEVIEGAEEEGLFASMYKEYLDTLNYYNKLMKNVKIKDYTGSVLGSAGNEGDDEDTIIDRSIVNGKMYDNLSYIVLSDLLSNEEQKEFLGTNIEKDKYYNIYLPEEKFVNDYDPEKESVIKWKVSATNKNKNEKTWKLDCEAIDTIKRGDVDTGIPVFINDANKCIINEEGLNDLFINDSINDKDTIYKTEYIK